MTASGWRQRALRLLSKDPAEHALAREVAALAWPAVLQGLVSTVVLLTDRLVLGRYASDALGSMQVSGPVLWSVFSLIGAFGVGTLAVVGRQSGGGHTAAVQATTRAVFRLALWLGLGVTVFGLLLRDPAGRWLASEASAAVRSQASAYMGVVYLVAPIQLLGIAATAVLQGTGDTRTPMQAGAAAAVLNLLLSGALTFGLGPLPELGVVGAAVGSAAAFTLQGVWLALSARARVARAPVKASIAMATVGAAASGAGETAGAAAAPHPLASVLRVSGPTFVERVLYHAGYLVFSSFIGRLGDAAMTAHQALLAIESLGYIAADGFGIAAGAIVARKLGAGAPDQAERGARLARRLGVWVLCGVGLFFLVAAEPLVALFSDDPAVQVLGARCLRVAVLAQPLMATVDALAYALRGAGATATPMRLALVGPVLVRLPACYFLAFELELGLLGIWMGATLDWAVRAVWLEGAFARGAWKHTRL